MNYHSKNDQIIDGLTNTLNYLRFIIFIEFHGVISAFTLRGSVDN